MDLDHALEIADESLAGGYNSMHDQALHFLAAEVRRRASPASVQECVTFIPDRIRKVESGFKGLFIKEAKAYKQGWNDCRAAMLVSAPTPPVSEDRWQPIETAPKDGRPVWVRGNDWGEDAGPNHYGWAYFDSGKWMWPAPVAEGGEAAYLTHWLQTQEST